MSIYIWIIIIDCIIAIGISLYLVLHCDVDFWDLFTIFILGAILQATIMCLIESKQPKPIDVYRGKTELEITSVNGVPRDTSVVWKLDGNI